jgi:chemotaxis-related protein WspB
MLYLLFELGGDRYALDVQHVVEVLPQVESKTLLGAAVGVTGLMNYRGKPVPLLDLPQLTLGQPCARRMSTRIIVTKWSGTSGESHLVGLLAERVTETMRRKASDFKEISSNGCRGTFAGAVATEGRSLIQRVEVKDLIPRSLQDTLFAEVEARRP